MSCPSCQGETDPRDHACPHCGAPVPVGPGSVVAGRYEVRKHLGSGGMGSVFEARDLKLGVPVALKVVRLGNDPHVLRRFRSEITLAWKVKHKNVCALREYGEDGDLAYITMELVEGRNLREVLRQEGPFDWERGFDLALQAAEGLQAIHEAGVIHRDLKSANLMLDQRDVVRLVDFGIAKAGPVPRAEGNSDRITESGQIIGSPEYMSPEQVRGEPLDARTDIYSFGVVLYEMFTGRVPFQGSSPVATMVKHLDEAPPLEGLQAAALPGVLLPLLRRSLAKWPGDRYPTAGALLQDLRRAQASQATRTDDRLPRIARGSRFSVVLGVMVLAAAAVWLPSVAPSRTGSTLPPVPVPTVSSSPSDAPPTTVPRTIDTPGPTPPLTRIPKPSHGTEPQGRGRPANGIPVPTTLPPVAPSEDAPSPAPTPENASRGAPQDATVVEPNIPAPLDQSPNTGADEPGPTTPTTEPIAIPKPQSFGDLFSANDSEVVPPSCVSCPNESLSPQAERLNLSGQVEMSILIDESGHVVQKRDVRVKGASAGELVKLAWEKVQKRLYTPAMKQGTAVRIWLAITVKFDRHP